MTIELNGKLGKTKKEILNIGTLEMFERLINRNSKPYDIDMMVMPGTPEDKHKNCETIPALRRQFNLESNCFFKTA